MPMTATVAPNFTKAHPRAAAIFDNLHMMHDIISDILAADTVPEGKKREVIYAALDEFQDTTRNVMSADEWLNMGHMMGGIAAMGGPATGVMPGAPSRNVSVDAMTGLRDHGIQHDAPTDSTRSDTADGMDHRAMGRAMPDSTADTTQDHLRRMMDLHMRMMSDPVIRKRVMADSAIRGMMQNMMRSMPAEHRGHMEQMMRQPPHPTVKPTDPHAPAKPAPSEPAPGQPKAKRDSMPAMDHSKMPGMQPSDS
jgi:hypothetical protein